MTRTALSSIIRVASPHRPLPLHVTLYVTPRTNHIPAILLRQAVVHTGGCTGRDRLEACPRGRVPPTVFQPDAPFHHVWDGDASAGHDTVHHHVRLYGVPQPR